MNAADLMPTVPATTEAALAVFDAAPPVEPEFMIGTWHGTELPTGHPMDGLLAASGWWGKQFIDAESVHPLLFPTRDARALWPMNPLLAFGGTDLARVIPGLTKLSLGSPVAATRRLWQTGRPRARLRTTRYRGVDSATMVYDQLPINDVFRRLSDDAVIGAMDLKGSAKPYFFLLQRNDSLAIR